MLEAGIDDLVVKPVLESDLAQALARWLPSVGVPRAIVIPAPVRELARRRGGGGPSRRRRRGGLRAPLRSLGDAAFVERMVRLFLADAEGRVTQVEEAAAAGDVARLRVALDALESIASTVGATALGRRAHELDDEMRESARSRWGRGDSSRCPATSRRPGTGCTTCCGAMRSQPRWLADLPLPRGLVPAEGHDQEQERRLEDVDARDHERDDERQRVAHEPAARRRERGHREEHQAHAAHEAREVAAAQLARPGAPALGRRSGATIAPAAHSHRDDGASRRAPRGSARAASRGPRGRRCSSRAACRRRARAPPASEPGDAAAVDGTATPWVGRHPTSRATSNGAPSRIRHARSDGSPSGPAWSSASDTRTYSASGQNASPSRSATGRRASGRASGRSPRTPGPRRRPRSRGAGPPGCR